MKVLSEVGAHIGILNAFFLSYLLVFFLKDHAYKIGFVDIPDPRKRHGAGVPVVGGIAVFMAFSLTALSNHLSGGPENSLLAGGAILMLEGALDDRYGFPAPPRFIAQISAAITMILLSGSVVQNLGEIASTNDNVILGSWSIPFTIFATVGVINAFNMVDGMDGLLGSLSTVSLIALTIVAMEGEKFSILTLILLLLSAIFAFLLFNVRTPWRARAVVFLGDAGSTFLGFAITWFVIQLSQGSNRAMPPAAALWILMVPLYDTIFVMCRRVIHGRSPFKADRNHLHHLIMRTGASVNRTLLVIMGAAVAGASFGLFGTLLGIKDRVLFISFLLGFGIYSFINSLLWRVVENSLDNKFHKFVKLTKSINHRDEEHSTTLNQKNHSSGESRPNNIKTSRSNSESIVRINYPGSILERGTLKYQKSIRGCENDEDI